MSTASTRLPERRFGRSTDESADRTLKVVGSILGTVLLVVVGWSAYQYIAQNKISGEVITFESSHDAVRIHLEVRKDANATGYCTLRSESADHTEVGRADFRVAGHAARIDTVVTLRTTSPGTTAELLGCHAD
jgi:hypothetical protein